MFGGLVFDPILASLIGPAIAGWLVVVVGISAILVLFISLWRGLRGAWWRGVTLALFSMVLAGPGIERGVSRPLSDIVLLIDDRSASQSLPGRRAQADAALKQVEDQIASWPDIESRRITVNDSEDGTLLGKALTQAIAEESSDRLAGVIIVSDGLASDLTAVPQTASAPVHLLQTGKSDDWDRRIVVDEAPRFSLIGETTTIRLHIADEGAVPENAQRSVRLSLIVDGAEINSVPAVPGAQIELPITFDVAGPKTVLISAEADNGELTTLNNQIAVSMNAVRDRLRVLLVSGEPNPGERVWRNLLKSDVNVDLIHFTILRPPEKFDGAAFDELALIRFPTEELFLERIQDFDLIIFDRYRMRGILLPEYYDNIRRYVEDGGALLVSAGPEFAGVNSIARSTLGQILPARPSGRVIDGPFLPQLTETGRHHPVTESLPGAPAESSTGNGEGKNWGRWLQMIETFPTRDSTVVMAGKENQPLLMLRRQGKGRVALIASDQIWLWGRGFEGGGPQLDLMRRVAHWTMKEPQLEEEALNFRAGPGMKLNIIRRSLTKVRTPVTITGPDGHQAEISLTEEGQGQFIGSYTAPMPGIYTARQDDLVRSVIIGPASTHEFDRTVASPLALAELIKATGGSVSLLSEGTPDLRRISEGRPLEGRGIRKNWIGLVKREAKTVTNLSRRALLPGWLWFMIVSFAMLAGWFMEGRRRI